MADPLSLAVQALQDILREPERAREIAETALADMMRKRMGLAVPVEGRVMVKIPKPETPGGWAKWVIGVDPEERGGYMFEGPFLPQGGLSPLPPGAVVLIGETSGPKRMVNAAVAYIVQKGGELTGNPRRAHRSEWRELAELIKDYLEARRDSPLLTQPVLPPAPPAPPLVIPPPAPVLVGPPPAPVAAVVPPEDPF